MAKSPVNLLQELVVKQGYFPVYDDVGIKKNEIYNQFVCKVKCKDLIAEGVGKTKKEAKQNAAENMLSLLARCNKISILPPATKVKNVQISTPTKICESISPSKMQVELTQLTQSSPDYVNYVGQLQEFFMQQSVQNVSYKVVEESGPPHERIFTIEVSLGSLRERGTAQTKKIAKQKAAKNLLQLLHPNKNMEKTEQNNNSNSKQLNKQELEDNIRKLGTEISKHVISKPKLPIVEMSKKAQTLYLTQTNKKIVRHDFLLKDIHNSFQEIYSSKISYIIKQKIKFVRDTHTNNANTIREVFQDIVRVMEIKMEKGVLPSSSKECYIVSFRLLSRPIIAQCGIAETIYKAEIKAMYNIIATISTLLNIF